MLEKKKKITPKIEHLRPFNVEACLVSCWYTLNDAAPVIPSMLFYLLNSECFFAAANAKLGAPPVKCCHLSGPLQITSASSPVVGMSVYGFERELS